MLETDLAERKGLARATALNWSSSSSTPVLWYSPIWWWWLWGWWWLSIIIFINEWTDWQWQRALVEAHLQVLHFFGIHQSASASSWSSSAWSSSSTSSIIRMIIGTCQARATASAAPECSPTRTRGGCSSLHHDDDVDNEGAVMGWDDDMVVLILENNTFTHEMHNITYCI